MNELTQMINSVGFPIVATCMMAYLLLNEQKVHKQETNQLKESIDANTIIMSELKQLLVDIMQFRRSNDIKGDDKE